MKNQDIKNNFAMFVGLAVGGAIVWSIILNRIFGSFQLKTVVLIALCYYSAGCGAYILIRRIQILIHDIGEHFGKVETTNVK